MRGHEGLTHFGTGGQHTGVLLDSGAIGHGLVAGQLFTRSHYTGLPGRHIGLGGIQCTFGVGQLRYRMVEFFFGHGTIADQRLAPIEVVVGSIDLALGATNVGLSTHHVGATQSDLCAQCAVVGIQGAHLAHGLGQVGLGLLQRHCGVCRVQLDQRLPGFDEVGVVGEDGHHRAANLGRDLDHVALHIGVVGGLEMAVHEVVIRCPTQARKDDNAGECDQADFAG